MKSNYFIGYSNDFNADFEARDNYLDVWKDVLLYSSSLHGNWLLSRQVFYESMVPTAEKDPAKFANWISKMVKTSGLKIKSRAGFLRALVYLRRLKRSTDKDEIKKALFNLFDSGLNEPLYAIKALNNQAG
jgi:hypothetical protein